MPLQQTFNHPSGFTANYWVASAIWFDLTSKSSKTTFSLYKDLAARVAGKEPIFKFTADFNGDDYPYTLVAMATKSPIQIAYENIVLLTTLNGGQSNPLFGATTVQRRTYESRTHCRRTT
jgi:hypothetical protein